MGNFCTSRMQQLPSPQGTLSTAETALYLCSLHPCKHRSNITPRAKSYQIAGKPSRLSGSLPALPAPSAHSPGVNTLSKHNCLTVLIKEARQLIEEAAKTQPYLLLGVSFLYPYRFKKREREIHAHEHTHTQRQAHVDDANKSNGSAANLGGPGLGP